jgi:cytochrome b561
LPRCSAVSWHRAAPAPRGRARPFNLAEIFFEAHSLTAWILVALVSLHVLAGLKHLLIDRNGVFQRMGFAHPRPHGPAD